MKTTNRFIALAASLVLAMTTSLASTAVSAKGDKGNKGKGADGGDNKVLVCHFGSHIGDYVVEEGTLECSNEEGEGEVVEISIPACINGHDVLEESCEGGDNPLPE